MPTTAWESYGLPGLIIAAGIYIFTHLGKYAIKLWMDQVQTSLVDLTHAVKEVTDMAQKSADRQGQSWEKYDRRMQQMIRAIAQLAVRMATTCPLVQDDDIPWEIVNGGSGYEKDRSNR